MATTNPPTWTESLLVLPPSQRLQLQKIVASDVSRQSTWPSTGFPQPPYSRAYASGGEKPTVSGGMGVFRSFILSRSSCGGHLSAIQRQFPSTAGVLAGMLAEAAKSAGKALPTQSVSLPSVEASKVLDPQLNSLAEEISASGLDASYRVALAKSLQRRIAGIPGQKQMTESGWEENSTAFPATKDHLLTGKLLQAANEVLQKQLAARVDVD